MKNIKVLSVAILLFWSTASFASVLLNQWQGTGMDADKIFCEYGDGQVKVIYGNSNCPLYN